MSVDDRRGAHTQKDFFDTHGHRSNMDGRDGRLSDLHGVVFIQLESSDWENIHGLLYPIFHSRCGLFYGLHAHISIFEVPISCADVSTLGWENRQEYVRVFHSRTQGSPLKWETKILGFHSLTQESPLTR